jgi:2-dehydro-3-deoxyphosphogluconate aldolase/(4S)-4-hydroxy-2-oxoglutarate aldolase
MQALFKKHPLIPVIVLEDANQAVPLARALLDGGVGIIEITFRTQAAANAIQAIREAIPEMLCGAGTVLTRDQVADAISAGAQFALAPCVAPDIVDYCRSSELPFIPGVATPSDINQALKLGCKYQKFFPAGALGGASALNAMAAPYLSQGVRFCPTGGVHLESMNSYLKLAHVFAVGGTWLAKSEDICSGNWSSITERCQIALERIGSTNDA